MFPEFSQYNSEMFGVLFWCLGVYQNVINEYHNKLVQIFHEDLIHEIHEVSWGIGQPKGHDRAFIQAISGYKCRLWNILGSDFQLVVPRSEVDLGEHLGPIELIKQIFNLGKWILVLDCNFIEGAVVNAQADGTVLLCHKQNR